MCLTCKYGQQTKEQKENLFICRSRVSLHVPNNKVIHLKEEQLNEIIDHALCIICTGVDLCIDIWAIQWENKYVVKTIII